MINHFPISTVSLQNYAVTLDSNSNTVESTPSQKKTVCYHCGDKCKDKPLLSDEKTFCCLGCQTVFELLQENELCDYYSFEESPGNQLSDFIKHKFDFLDNEEIASKLIDFESEKFTKITFSIPSIHCSSCIWLLENISRFDQGVIQSNINFSGKTLTVDFDPNNTTLNKIASLLYQLGYEPDISLHKNKIADNSEGQTSYLKIGIAGFAFGNIMLLAFPEYLNITVDAVIDTYFTYISLGLALPILFYCSNEFFVSAYGGIKKKILNIDLPISIGILALFFRSIFEIWTQTGVGYLDSMSGLVFFLLIGRWFQNKTYKGMSFERDFESYFPLAVQKIVNNSKKSTLVEKLEVNDIIEIRNEEIIPCDAILISNEASIDYSFVTGESQAIQVEEGDKIFAGGKIVGIAAQMTVIKEVSQSYLTQLWNNKTFDEDTITENTPLIDKVSQYFTPIVLLTALFSGVYWQIVNPEKTWFVVSSVLIIACPCALALATPFTLSATMNLLGKSNMYIKGTQVIEKIWQIKRIVFDKTGTITSNQGKHVEWVGNSLSEDQTSSIHAVVSQSTHPLSLQIASHLAYQNNPLEVVDFEELKGKGIIGKVKGEIFKIGSANFTGIFLPDSGINTSTVFVSINEQHLGYFMISNSYRHGLKSMIDDLKEEYAFSVLSGDNSSEENYLHTIFPKGSELLFNLDPQQKLQQIKTYNTQSPTLMIGDGLNDAGALKASHVGISITENKSAFTPASDIILLGAQLTKMPQFLKLMTQSKTIILTGFALSFTYNIIGLGFAVSGHITPIIAAILMPISSISVVVFSTLSMQWLGRKLEE